VLLAVAIADVVLEDGLSEQAASVVNITARRSLLGFLPRHSDRRVSVSGNIDILLRHLAVHPAFEGVIP
jgi:hypothetical protein